MSFQHMQMELEDLVNELASMPAILKRRGKEFAQAEYDYKIALAKELLILRQEGNSVTLSKDLALGTPHIATLRRERDIKESYHRAALEAINIKKIQIRVIENQMDREWHSG